MILSHLVQMLRGGRSPTKQFPAWTVSPRRIVDCFAFGFDTGEKSTRLTQPAGSQ
jgi:hypothetical protein